MKWVIRHKEYGYWRSKGLEGWRNINEANKYSTKRSAQAVITWLGMGEFARVEQILNGV